MQLQVGTYTLDTSFTPSWTRVMVRSDRGYAQRIRATLAVQFDLYAESVSEMTATIQGLIDAISGDYQDVLLLDDDGGQTPWCLINADTIDGVKLMTPPSFPDVSSVYALKVSGEMAWQADFPPDDVTNGPGQPNLLAFSETLTFQGNGGPIKTITLTPRGEPIEVTLAERTPFFASQAGSISAVGPISNIPQPIWPDKLVNPASTTERSSPNVRNGVIESYSASWNYQFQSITPLVGQPTQFL